MSLVAHKYKNKVIYWLWTLCFLVVAMVMVGGITRLTGSGLSIVEWKPLMGAVPPLNHEEWIEVYAKYQSSPQGQMVNQGMTLSEFQWIFFWEYIHRLIGRLLGFVFLIPWLWFWTRGYFDKTWAAKFGIGFLLGGLQGVVGWVMVASGLVDRPQVSHYRLAAHLLLALFILGYFWRMSWLFLNIGGVSLKLQKETLDNSEKLKSFSHAIAIRRSLKGLLGLLLFQIFYGALVAGLKAGHMSNSFPLMDGEFFPISAWAWSQGAINLLENPLVVQWVHRTVGWIILGATTGVFFYFKNKIERPIQKKLAFFWIIVLCQFVLGVGTLVMHIPLGLAVTHQVFASLVLLTGLWFYWELSPRKRSSLQPQESGQISQLKKV